MLKGERYVGSKNGLNRRAPECGSAQANHSDLETCPLPDAPLDIPSPSSPHHEAYDQHYHGSDTIFQFRRSSILYLLRYSRFTCGRLCTPPPWSLSLYRSCYRTHFVTSYSFKKTPPIHSHALSRQRPKPRLKDPPLIQSNAGVRGRPGGPRTGFLKACTAGAIGAVCDSS